MAKRKAPRRAKRTESHRKRLGSHRSGKHPTTRAEGRHPTTARKKKSRSKKATGKKAAAPAALKATASKPPVRKRARLDSKPRPVETSVPTPPSSLDLKRQGSAVRTGRHELLESLQEHAGMTPVITGGDVDANWENAYFSGDEAPGGDNPTPDQDVVDDIGKALGVQYDDNEELKAGDKVVERDKHRWELDPASSEDYRDRR